MVTANDITQYQPNAGDALATQGGPWGVAETPRLNETMRELALQSVGRNKTIYEQRVKDRDKIYSMIDDKELIPKDILDEDRDRVNAKIQKFKDVFLKYGGDITSDPARYAEFMQAKNDAENDINTSQKRAISVGLERGLAAKSANPTDYAAHQKYVDDYVKNPNNFGKALQPFVKFLDWNIDHVAPEAPRIDSDARYEKDKNGNWKVVDSTVDVDKVKKYFQSATANKDTAFEFTNAKGTGYLDHFLMSPNAAKWVADTNAKITEHNQALGLKKGDANFLTPLEDDIVQNPGGSYRLKNGDATAEVAAKLAIAGAEAKKTTRTPNKELNDYGQDNQRIAETHRHNVAEEGEAHFRDGIEKKYKDWQMEGGSKAEQSKRNDSLKYAQDKVLELAGMGQQFYSKDGKRFLGAIVPAEKTGLISPEIRNMLGKSELVEGKKTITPEAFKDKVIYIDPDGKIYTADKDKLRVDANGHPNIALGDMERIGDPQQMAEHHLNLEASDLKGNLGALSNIETNGESGPTYDRKTKDTKTSKSGKSGGAGRQTYLNPATGKRVYYDESTKSYVPIN